MKSLSTNNQPTKNISLDDDTFRIINDFKDTTGLNNFSAAVRFIVNDWHHFCRKPKIGTLKGKLK